MADVIEMDFDRAETISEALHAQAGIEQALLDVLILMIKLSPEQEHKLMALIAAGAAFRETAMRAADGIARSGPQSKPSSKPEVLQ